MVRILLSSATVLAACTPSAQEATMHNQDTVSGTLLQGSAGSGDSTSGAAGSTSVKAGDGRAALGPVPEAVSAAENPAPSAPADSPVEANGRQILSTAFVRVGPDRRLVVELHNGRMIDLRNVVMRAKDYCGEQVLGGSARSQFCGRYGEIAAARPGAAVHFTEPDPAVSQPIEGPANAAKPD